MRLNTTLLYRLPLAAALFAAGIASAQTTDIVSIKVPAASSATTYVAGSLSVAAQGVQGAKEPARVTHKASSNASSRHTSGPSSFYPGDVSNPNPSGPTLTATQHHPIYVNQTPSHWGNVGGFLTDLGKSDFIHLVDQYTGNYSDNRYTLGTSFQATYPIPANHTLQINDILALVHAGAAIKGNGYGHVYHVFLPQGVDMCWVDGVGGCYSPDNIPTFVFCAFHSAVDFTDAVGHVLFTVEPYQNTPGCSAPPSGTANSQLIDSTNDTLSHEIFETISDPDLDAWWVQALTFAYGNEIGDLCTNVQQIGAHYYSYNPTIPLNGHWYTIQAEYSNRMHGCSSQGNGLN